MTQFLATEAALNEAAAAEKQMQELRAQTAGRAANGGDAAREDNDVAAKASRLRVEVCEA